MAKRKQPKRPEPPMERGPFTVNMSAAAFETWLRRQAEADGFIVVKEEHPDGSTTLSLCLRPGQPIPTKLTPLDN